MSRRVRRKVARKGKEKLVLPSYPKLKMKFRVWNRNRVVDWTSLPDDTVIQLFSCLNYRDRNKLIISMPDMEVLGVSPYFCERISSDAIKATALCCPKLKKLRLSGIQDVHGDAINALAKHCPNLTDIGFIDCLNVDEIALGNVLSVRFLSVAGTSNMKWGAVSHHWHKLPNLTGLDVSRTDIGPTAVSRLLSSSQSLKVLCALNCSVLEEDVHFAASKIKGRNVFLDWRSSRCKDKNLDEMMIWLEWILSLTLLRIAESSQQGLDEFWLKQGAALLLNLMHSSQEDVQERAATGLATFVVIDDENTSIHHGRAEAVMQDGGIHLLLNLAKSWREGLQSEAAKAIANLSVHSSVAKAVAEEGGINILAGLARSVNRLVAEEAAGGLWNLSSAIAEAGGVKALVDLIFKWFSDGDGVLERAAGALANLAADDECTEVAVAGGVHALVMLARNCKCEGVQEQAARALANLAAHGDSNSNNAAVGQEAGALEALVQLTQSPHEGVRQEAAGALWNLSFDDRNGKQLQQLVALKHWLLLHKPAQMPPQVYKKGLLVLSGDYQFQKPIGIIAIGQEGGVAPLIALAALTQHQNFYLPVSSDVHETAAGALWNLAFNPGNALRIVEEGGVPALVHLCSSSVSKMARFMAALALAYMFDGRMDEYALIGTSSESISKGVSLDGARRMALKNIESFVLKFSDQQSFSAAAASSLLVHWHNGAEIGRFVAMLRNPSSVLKACAAFALLQFTIPGGRHAMHHASLMLNAGAAGSARLLQRSNSLAAKIFARIVLRNLEHHNIESSL
ncbi:hypothetical protein FNV43_RR17648 [Rhamnella rubrinervis]|uniref:Uncharacterized protein n=1 Tax=Rhamnella rubrinervis TaxID=2594499 RepID=A0A8K0DZ73_9ROSA|nr:hypothetical protein FNV43_RR17648 [Rhamnella rubrinervis]